MGMDGHVQACYDARMHSPHPQPKTPAQTPCQTTTPARHPHNRAAPPQRPLAACLQAHRDELLRRILAGEFDDTPLRIAQIPQPPAPSRRPPHRPIPATAITHCRATRQHRR
jgi:hypothetical protein